MGKKKDKKLHKHDQIDNNYLNFDKNITDSMIMCGIATGVSCVFFGILPMGVIMFMITMLEHSQKYIEQAIFVLVCCAVGIIGSLVTSIVAKAKFRKSRWAVTNIVYISINLVCSGLVSWFFIWLIYTYGS